MERIYKSKDVEFILASEIIIDSAIAHEAEIILKRPTWANPYFQNLKTRINTASSFLGVDNAKQLREATQQLMAVIIPAWEDLSTFSINIKEDFKRNPRLQEILTTLGFKAHYKNVLNEDQEATIELLLKFSTNMNAVLQAEVTTAGMDPALIARLMGYAGTVGSNNVLQELAKANRKGISAAGVTEFNAIYDLIIAICKISSNIFKKNLEVKEKFSFAKVVKRLNP